MNKTKNKFQIPVFALIFIASLASFHCAQDKKSERNVNTTRSGTVKDAVISVEGMMCISCVSRVKRKLHSLDGVDSIQVDLESKRASFIYDNANVNIEEIRQAINDLGYTAGEPEIKDDDL